jgi:hypothetical protein
MYHLVLVAKYKPVYKTDGGVGYILELWWFTHTEVTIANPLSPNIKNGQIIIGPSWIDVEIRQK